MERYWWTVIPFVLSRRFRPRKGDAVVWNIMYRVMGALVRICIIQPESHAGGEGGPNNTQ